MEEKRVTTPHRIRTDVRGHNVTPEVGVIWIVSPEEEWELEEIKDGNEIWIKRTTKG